MKPIALLVIVAVTEIWVANSHAQGACPNGARGISTSSVPLTMTTPSVSSGLLQQAYLQQLAYQQRQQQAYLQQAYWQQQNLQQQSELAQPQDPSRESKSIARQERKAAEKARREAAKANKSRSRNSQSNRLRENDVAGATARELVN